ncbi:hypothetical protein sos41_27330 [Alphaproteobacteria bacterium SO-S41]|nr:hypothetical protein sos41_27330 [Alphaproteobacteria bacterium SO-S41]
MKSIITRSYDHYTDAKSAVRALKEAGFKDEDISLVAHKDSGDDVMDGVATGAGVGAVAGGGAGLLAGLGLLAIPGVGPVVAAGWLAATAAGAAAGAVAGAATGGLIDALTGTGVRREDAELYAENVRRGGSVVSVRAEESRVLTAQAILDQYRPVDIAGRRKAYEASGWNGHTDEAAPYTRAEIEAERTRYL